MHRLFVTCWWFIFEYFLFLLSLQLLEIDVQVLETLIRLWNTSLTRLNTTLQSLSKNMCSTSSTLDLHMTLTPPRFFLFTKPYCFCRRLFGNRSFCFEKMQEYEKALADAELCVNLCPGWVKGLFRKGRALAGLKVKISMKCKMWIFLVFSCLHAGFTCVMWRQTTAGCEF